MQIKTTKKYHLTPGRRVLFSKSTNYKCWRGCGKMGTRLHCWWECKLVQPLWNTEWRFLRKLNTELPYDPAIPLLGTYLGKNHNSKGTCTPMFTAALFTISPGIETTEMSIPRRMGYNAVHVHNGILPSHKKDEVVPLAPI